MYLIILISSTHNAYYSVWHKDMAIWSSWYPNITDALNASLISTHKITTIEEQYTIWKDSGYTASTIEFETVENLHSSHPELFI